MKVKFALNGRPHDSFAVNFTVVGAGPQKLCKFYEIRQGHIPCILVKFSELIGHFMLSQNVDLLGFA